MVSAQTLDFLPSASLLFSGFLFLISIYHSLVFFPPFPYLSKALCSTFFFSPSLDPSVVISLIFILSLCLCFFSLDDKIQKLNDLIQAVKDIGDWQGLCTNLGVSEGVIDTLVHSTATVDTKKADCLRAYFKSGEAKWSNVVKAVVMYPISNKLVAKQIAKAHGLDNYYNNVVKNEL